MSERLRAWFVIVKLQLVFKIFIVCCSTRPDKSMHRAFTGLSFTQVATSKMGRNGAPRVHQI
jgi:hypothetical protein